MSRSTLRIPHMLPFRVRGYHPLSPLFPKRSTTTTHDYGYWAGPISLAATFRISVDFFSSRYLDVSVPRVCLTSLCIQLAIPVNRWVSPFGNLRFIARLSAPRSLSQTSTSFIASYRQGIHRMHLITWLYNRKSL